MERRGAAVSSIKIESNELRNVAGVQPWWIQGIRSEDGVGEDQETIA